MTVWKFIITNQLNHNPISQLQQTSSRKKMVRSKTRSRRRVNINLNPVTFEKMLKEIISKYGDYGIKNEVIFKLKICSECFLEDFWEEVKDIAVRSGRSSSNIELRDVLLWKRKNNFKLIRKNRCVSLCKLFGSMKRVSPIPNFG